MKKIELVFIPSPVPSHLISTVETAKLLLDRDHRRLLSITVLIMRLPNDTAIANYIEKISSTTDSNSTSSSRLCFVNLPYQDHETAPSKTFLFDVIDSQETRIREIISSIIKKQPSTSQIGALVLDMFCTKFIEIADEFGLSAYVFLASSACALGLFRHLVEHDDQELRTKYKDNSDIIELSVPCFSIPVPANVLPSVIVDGGPVSTIFLNHLRRFKYTKGIVVNTFYELESYAVDSLLMSSDERTPKIYPIGPILNSSGGDENSESFDDEITKWLDEQPENSVVFLCFGTMGSFEESQVKEIALGLEKSGSRFLWSLRRPVGKAATAMQFPTEYEDLEEVLPEGFLERTKGVGKVIGWVAQVAVLSHAAVGGFVSHCGWHSILESVWFGVPVATFPMYAEQQLNAFELVKELGMAVEIRIDYKIDFRGEGPTEIVGAAEIEAAIRRLMAEEGGSGVRGKVKEMQNMGRMALLEGGSSYHAQSVFIEDVIANAT